MKTLRKIRQKQKILKPAQKHIYDKKVREIFVM